MDLVIRRDKSIEYAEERRLFYVALTRTSNRVYIVAPETRPSEFVTELIQDKGYKNIIVKGVFNESLKPRNTFFCPDCGFPLRYRKANQIGIPLYICTNEHELCGFMTNDIRGGRLRILKCSCLDGYLIVRKKNDENSFFLGCTNYAQDGTGCNETISLQRFEAQFPQPCFEKRLFEESLERPELHFEGEAIEIIDTSDAIAKAEELRSAQKPSGNKAKVKGKEASQPLHKTIMVFCSKFQSLELKTTDHKLTYVRKGWHSHLFWIDLRSNRFYFVYDRTKPAASILIEPTNIKDIFSVISRIIKNSFDPKAAPTSVEGIVS